MPDGTLADNTSFEQWSDEGSANAETRANAVWKKMLADYQAPSLDSGVDEALRDFMARKKQAVPDEWY